MNTPESRLPAESATVPDGFPSGSAEAEYRPASLFPEAEAEAAAEAQHKAEDEAHFARLREEKRQRELVEREAQAETERKAAADARKPLNRFLTVLAVILTIIANVFLFLPLCILGIFGLTKHPFISYFIFRDYLRSR